jgi:hypothetical protein
MKSASLTSALLAPKGRASPASLIDKLVAEVGVAARGETRATDASRWEAAEQLRRDYALSEPMEASPMPPPTAVVVPLPHSGIEVEHHGADHGHRKKLSVRLEPLRHMKLKLAAFHMGLSAQELITRALDRYIESVAPEVAQTLPMSPAGQRLPVARAGGSEAQGPFAPVPQVKPAIPID